MFGWGYGLCPKVGWNCRLGSIDEWGCRVGSVAECCCKLALWLPRIIVQASWLNGAEAMLNSWAGLLTWLSAQVGL